MKSFAKFLRDANSESLRVEQEMADNEVARYLEEHPLDGNASYARRQGDDLGARGEMEEDYK